jgi:hypothetical protein
MSGGYNIYLKQFQNINSPEMDSVNGHLSKVWSLNFQWKEQDYLHYKQQHLFRYNF